jgi:hypothetical protein
VIFRKLIGGISLGPSLIVMNKHMTVDDLKALLLGANLEEFVDSVVLAEKSPHFSAEQVGHVAAALSTKFATEVVPAHIHIVGSAKLGFGLFQKKTRDGEVLPALRPFRPDSDIDIAVVCPIVFELIWQELSSHANSNPWMPWDSGKLGDYLIHGWLRPDHFPKHVRLRRCDDWWDVFYALSADSRLGRRTIRGALYYSLEQLRRYQLRGLNQCRLKLESQL